MANPCGCRVWMDADERDRAGWDEDVTIDYCPTHAAAAEALEMPHKLAMVISLHSGPTLNENLSKPERWRDLEDMEDYFAARYIIGRARMEPHHA